MAKRFLEVIFGAKTDGLKRGVNDAKSTVGSFEKTVKAAGVALIGAFAAQRVIGGLRGMIKELTNTADRLNDLQDMTGITTDKLQEYEYVARIAGVNTEALAQASLGLTRRLAGATTEASPLNQALKDLGVEARNSSGELRSGGDVMDDLINKLAGIENQTERNVMGAQVFGGAWKDMAPILAMGADGIEKVRQEARDLGIIMDRDTIRKANELRIAQERLGAVSQTLGRELTMLFVPALTSVGNVLTDIVSDLNKLSAGFRAVTDNDNLSRWDKLKTKMQVVFGLGTGNAAMAAKGISVMATSQAEYNQKLDEQIDLTQQAADVTRSEEIRALGDIGRIREEIKQQELAFIQGNSDAERTAAQIRINELENELDMLTKIAQTRAIAARIGLGAPQAAASIGPGAVGGQTGIQGGGPQVDTTVMEVYDRLGKTLSDLEEKQIAFGESINVGGLEIAAYESAINNLIDSGFMAMDAEVAALIERLNELKAAQDGVKQSTIDWQNVALTSASAIGGAFAAMVQGGKKSTGEIVKQSLAQAIAFMIPQLIKLIPPPGNIIAAAAVPAVMGGIFSKIPAFAGGGRVTSPTLAMFGEYPGASSNPEYALRQDQLMGLMSKSQPSGPMTVRWVQAGPDMLGIIEEANRRYK